MPLTMNSNLPSLAAVPIFAVSFVVVVALLDLFAVLSFFSPPPPAAPAIITMSTMAKMTESTLCLAILPQK
jgi:hypothetical protein